MNKKTIAVAIALVLTIGIVFVSSKKEEEKLTPETWTTNRVSEYTSTISTNDIVCILNHGFLVKNVITNSITNIVSYVYVPSLPFPTQFVTDKATVTATLNSSFVHQEVVWKLQPVSNSVNVTTITF